MTVVNPKSISGINSITTGSGSDNLLTIHTSDANNTERLRIDSTGATKIVTGIVTTLTATGSAKVGSGVTLSPDGNIFTTGVTTATTFVGALTGNVTGNATGLSGTPNISAGTIAGSTGTFTGDVDIADKIVHTGDTDTAIRFPAADTITAETGGTERLQINSSGDYLFLGGTLRIKNSANNAQYGAIYGDSTSFHVNAGGNLKLYSGGGERVRIFSDGNVQLCNPTGVGNSNPAFGASTVGGMVRIDGTTPTLYMRETDRDVGAQDFYIGRTSETVYMGNQGGDIVFQTSDNGASTTERCRIRATSAGLAIGGTGDANTLDDYEEGTYTPVIYYDSVNNHTYSEQVGTYTKIGNFCHGYIVITWDENASSGQVGFSLPFTSSNISGTRTSGYFIYQDGLNIPSGQGSTHLILYGGQNSSQIAVYFTGGTNNSELGTNSTKLTNTHTSSHNTARIVFHYRTA
jgi:hypothetical protein